MHLAFPCEKLIVLDTFAKIGTVTSSESFNQLTQGVKLTIQIFKLSKAVSLVTGPVTSQREFLVDSSESKRLLAFPP